MASVITEDFSSKTTEFWEYVEDKLRVFEGKIQRLYRDELCEDGEKALTYLSSMDKESYRIARRLADNGAVFVSTEEPTLVAETASWAETIRRDPSDNVASEMYQETIRERDSYVSKRVNETLQDEEIGLLFMSPDRTIRLDDSIRIIKVCRFDPADYLRSWCIRLEPKRSGT